MGNTKPQITKPIILLLHARGSTTHGAHGVQAGSQLGVLLLDLQLGAGGLGIRNGVYDLGLGASELGGPLEVLEGLGDLALLQEQLGHGANGNIALGVDYIRDEYQAYR